MGQLDIEALLEGLAGRVSDEVEAALGKRLSSLENGVQALNGELDSLSKSTAYLMAKEGGKLPEEVGEGDPVAQLDQIWQCRRCGARLGFYSPDEDVLRLRHKDFLCWLELGVGGKFSIACRSCTALNSLEYTPPEDRHGAPGSSKP